MANPPANHGDIPKVCTLTTRSKAHACVNAALSSKFGQTVDDNTELKTQNGLGLDDEELENDVLHVIERAVERQGCALRNLVGSDISSCDTAGDIGDKVFDDLTQ